MAGGEDETQQVVADIVVERRFDVERTPLGLSVELNWKRSASIVAAVRAAARADSASR